MLLSRCNFLLHCVKGCWCIIEVTALQSCTYRDRRQDGALKSLSTHSRPSRGWRLSTQRLNICKCVSSSCTPSSSKQRQDVQRWNAVNMWRVELEKKKKGGASTAPKCFRKCPGCPETSRDAEFMRERSAAAIQPRRLSHSGRAWTRLSQSRGRSCIVPWCQHILTYFCQCIPSWFPY